MGRLVRVQVPSLAPKSGYFHLDLTAFLFCFFCFAVLQKLEGEYMAYSKRNNALEFYRFVFIVFIFFMHFRSYGGFEGDKNYFAASYLGVEYFFILSGFFMMQKIEKLFASNNSLNPEKSTVSFFAARVKRLYPLYIFSLFLFMLALKIVKPEYGLLSHAKDGFADFFMLQVFFEKEPVNLHLWFVSGLLWGSFLAYYLAVKYREKYTCIIAPLAFLGFAGYCFTNFGKIDITSISPVFLGAFFRAFSEIGIGCTLYCIYNKLKNRDFSKLDKITLSVLEIILPLLCGYIAWRGHWNILDFIALFAICALILVTALGQGVVSKLLNNKFSGFLGSITYAMYLNQAVFIYIGERDFNCEFRLLVLVDLACLVAFSAVVTAAYNKIVSKLKNKSFNKKIGGEVK